MQDSHSNNVKEWLSRSFASRSDQLLACGALIISELRTAVVKETQFTTSAGIAHNKVCITKRILPLTVVSISAS